MSVKPGKKSLCAAFARRNRATWTSPTSRSSLLEPINDATPRPVREKVSAVSRDSRRALALAALLAGAGATHFAVPKFYDEMIPRMLPGPARTWTYGAAIAEFGTAAALLPPRTRHAGGLAAAILFAAVLPGNIKMALDARRSNSTAYRVGTVLRLPLQLPLIAWALKVRHRAQARG
jgi:uncharacterized membrane protein